MLTKEETRSIVMHRPYALTLRGRLMESPLRNRLRLDVVVGNTKSVLPVVGVLVSALLRALLMIPWYVTGGRVAGEGSRGVSSSGSSPSCSMGAIRLSRDRPGAGFSVGLLRFLTRLNVFLSMPEGVLGVFAASCSSSSGSLVAKGSMVRNCPRFIWKPLGVILLDRGGLCMAVDDEDELERVRIKVGSVAVRRMPVARRWPSVEPPYALGGISTMEGLPWKTTVTTRAVSSRLERQVEADLCESPASRSISSKSDRSDRSSAEDEASSSDER